MSKTKMRIIGASNHADHEMEKVFNGDTIIKWFN